MWLSQGQHLASIGTRTNPAIGLVPKAAGLQLKSPCPARIDYGGKYLSELLGRSSTHTAAGWGGTRVSGSLSGSEHSFLEVKVLNRFPRWGMHAKVSRQVQLSAENWRVERRSLCLFTPPLAPPTTVAVLRWSVPRQAASILPHGLTVSLYFAASGFSWSHRSSGQSAQGSPGVQTVNFPKDIPQSAGKEVAWASYGKELPSPG